MGDRPRPYALVVLDECDECDGGRGWCVAEYDSCLLYTSDAADDDGYV